MWKKLIISIMLFMILILLTVNKSSADPGGTQNYGIVMIWKLEADSTKTFQGAWSSSMTPGEDVKNSWYRLVKYLNDYKAQTGDSGLDSLIFLDTIAVMHDSLLVCASSDTIFCSTVARRSGWGGVGYVPVE